MDDVEAYNNYDEMPLFIDFPKKISVVEKNLPKDIMPWEQKGRIIYLAPKQISVSYLALKNLNFFIWHLVEIYFRKWHYRPFRTVTVSSDWQNDMNTLVYSRNL